MIRKAYDYFTYQLRRRKALATATANAAHLRLQGYQFVPVRDGLFYVYRLEDAGPYELQLYRDRATNRMDYKCSCESCQGWGFCKHGIHQVEFLRSILPEVRCAEAAPERPAGFRRQQTSNALSGGATNNFATAVNRPVSMDSSECGRRSCSVQGIRYQELDSRDFSHDANDPRNERSFN